MGNAMERIKVTAGDFVILQNQGADCLYFLHQGRLEVVVVEGLREVPDAKTVAEAGTRIGHIEEGTPFGEMGWIEGSRRSASVRAVVDSEVSRIPLEGARLEAFVSRNPLSGALIARTLLYRYLNTLQQVQRLSEVLSRMQRLRDNLSLVLFTLHDRQSGDLKRILGDSEARLMGHPSYRRGRDTHDRLMDQNLELPAVLGPGLLEETLGTRLGVRYGLSLDRDASLMPPDLAGFLENLLDLRKDFEDMVARRPAGVVHLVRYLVDNLSKVNATLLAAGETCASALREAAVDPGNPLEMLLMLYDLMTKSGQMADTGATLRDLLSKSRDMIDQTSNLYLDVRGRTLANVCAVCDDISARLKMREEKPAAPQAIVEEPGAQMDGHLDRVLNFLQWDGVARKDLLNNLETLRAMPDKFSQLGEAGKVKRGLAEAAWDLYARAAAVAASGAMVPPSVQIFLRFGLLDEHLIDGRHQNELLRLAAHQSKAPAYPIYYADDWLRLIYRSQENPSLNELGQSYQELNEEALRRAASKKKEPVVKAKDPGVALVEYETRDMFKPASRIAVSTPGANLPFLVGEFIHGDLEKSYVSPERLAEAVTNLLNVDFMAFHREVRLVVAGKTDFAQKTVAPNFILLPVYGKRAFCWQELDGRSKDSRGRLIFPVFLEGSLEDTVMEAVAYLRWELAKTIAGYNWGNPVEGGVTGKYFDYTSFYSKSLELSSDAKDEITEEFKRLRSTRERFISDYLKWMKYEQHGILKMNPLTRQIFFQYVPFPKVTRDRLAAVPLYERISRIDTNLRTRRLKELTAHLSHYEKEHIAVPQMMKDMVDLLNK